MKKILLLALLALLGLAACRETSDSNWLRTSTGKPYEVFVVMPEAKWNGEVGDTLRSILREPFPMVNQYEPFYSLYQTSEKRFSGLLQQYRNILIYRIDPAKTEPSMTAEYDKWSKPQIVVYVDASSDSTAIAYMDEHRDALLDIFDLTEQERFMNAAKIYTDTVIMNTVQRDFGLNIRIPKGYKVRSEHPDLIWISYELPLVSQGIVIYKYPLTSRLTFTPEYQFEKRNEFVRLIPGPSDGSYMTTSNIAMPLMVQTEFNDRTWFRAQGFWDVEGDYMGGPYTSYSTINTSTREVVTIDTYVFSPKYDKRQYVRQLQSIAQTATIPDDQGEPIHFSELPE
jgi:hypothetical protein